MRRSPRAARLHCDMWLRSCWVQAEARWRYASALVVRSPSCRYRQPRVSRSSEQGRYGAVPSWWLALYQRAVDVTRGLPRRRFRDSFNSHQMWGLEWGRRSIKEDRSPAELRERDGRVAARLYAIANALDRMSRSEAVRLAGMERQALRDAVLRY